MQRLEVSGAVRPIYGSLSVKRLMVPRALSLRVKQPGREARDVPVSNADDRNA